MSCSGLVGYNEVTRSRLAEIEALAQRDDLCFDPEARRVVEQVLALLDDLSRQPAPTNVHAREQRLRASAQLAAACRLAFDWRSPGYAQAGVLSVGDIRSLVDDLEALLEAPVNYARWHQPGLDLVERALGEQLGVDEERDVVLATSSGLAALSVVLGVLRETGRLGRALMVPGTYFETHPTLRLFGPTTIRVASRRDAEGIAAEAAAWRADVVFADPLEHGPEQRIVDVEELAERVCDAAPAAALVVDGTMAPASGVLAAIAPRFGRVLYYESCAKYRQMGLDLALGGTIVVPRRYAGIARNARQSLGALLDRFGCEASPRPDARELADRLRSMELAAGMIARAVEDHRPPGWRVVHPSLIEHPDAALAARRRYVGACVTFVPDDDGTHRVLRFAKRAIDFAAHDDVALVVGESLGFTACRLTPTVAAHGVTPFARLAVGAVPDEEARAVAAVLARAAAEV